MGQLRPEVLKCYKHVLRTILKVFSEDHEAIRLIRNQAREEFRKNPEISDPTQIEQRVRLGYESAEILRKTVIQARLNAKGNYEAKIGQENLDNAGK